MEDSFKNWRNPVGRDFYTGVGWFLVFIHTVELDHASRRLNNPPHSLASVLRSDVRATTFLQSGAFRASSSKSAA